MIDDLHTVRVKWFVWFAVADFGDGASDHGFHIDLRRAFDFTGQDHVEARLICLRFGQGAYFRANEGECIQLVKISD